MTQWLGKTDDAFLIGSTHHEGPLTIGEDLLENDDLADSLEFTNTHHVEGLIEQEFLSRLQMGYVDVGDSDDPHLASRHGDIEAAIVQRREEDPVTAGRLGQAIDLTLESHDVLASLTQGGHQARVVGLSGGQFRLEGAGAILGGRGLWITCGHDLFPSATGLTHPVHMTLPTRGDLCPPCGG